MLASPPATPRLWPDGPPVQEVLAQRPARPADHESENRVLCELAQALAERDGNVLQQLVEAAVRLCGAHTAGVSLIEMDGVEKVFRWHAVAGRWSHYLMGSMPRNASPCGIVVDRHAAQLMPKPELYFPAMLIADPPAAEALLVPFDVMGETVGTVWVVSHDDSVRFTAEDLRIVASLAHFAAAAYLVRMTLRRTLETGEELSRANERLKRTNDRLWRQLQERDSSLDPSVGD